MGNDRLGKPELQATLVNTVPLYLQLRDIMIDRIRSKEWRPGSPLPNELALSYEFQVSIGTIRKAMLELDAQGLVVRHQGRGTFVADRLTTTTASLLDRVRHRDGSAITWDPPHTSVTIEPADPRETELFGPLSNPAHLLQFEWVLGAGGRRMVLQNTAVPTELVAMGAQQARHIGNLDELFDRARILLDRTEVALSVAPADARVAQLLKVTPGAFLQRLERRLFDLHGRAVAISNDWLALAGEVYTHVQHRSSG